MSLSERVRVLVVDDSALMRKLIPQILAQDSDIEVVGTAMDGEFGLRKIEELRPHVVTLDLEMPRMDGMETLRQITRRFRTPVIVVSALTTEGASTTFKALAMGAFDFVAKPRDAASAHLDAIAKDLIAKIKAAARSKSAEIPVLRELPKAAKKPGSRERKEPTKIVAIGISTGGPHALQYVFSQLPGDFSGSIVVVQHMPQGFTEMFARRLDECSAIDVKEGRSGDLLIAGRALICPGNRHMKVRRMPLGNTIVLSDDALANGHRPSADVLFRSIATEFGGRAIGVLMTGMGDDGAEGLGLIKRAGGLTIAQSEESCVVFGMPKAAIERGYVTRVVPLDALANTITVQCGLERAALATRV
ncbi:MAG TPA: chemotaxis response regulator protein-glutamate methylesterase [Verrucomicrobiae bacterium]|jgi:two-component system chemotaxis response regulator CheB|nr:chemotaxis response regulator protein-glutamate methylesterase [Verrucomicrobiae bacterium]